MKNKDIHTNDYGNTKWHNYGIHGEHAHDYEWNEDSSLNNKTTRELTKEERKDNGKKSGITSEFKNSVPTFQAWHGSKVKEYSNIDDVMNDKFYSGKSITDLAGKITFSFA